MKALSTVLSIFVLFSAVSAQTKLSTQPIWLVDFVKAKPGHYDDYLESCGRTGRGRALKPRKADILHRSSCSLCLTTTPISTISSC